MMFKPFFVHQRQVYNDFPSYKRYPKAYTVWVRPDLENAQHCLVSGTWCSSKDQFVRKIGCQQAMIAEARSINKRDLPQLLSRMRGVLHGRESMDTADASRYYYIWKYML